MPSLRERLGLKRRPKKVPDKHESLAESDQFTPTQETSLPQEPPLSQETSPPQEVSLPRIRLNNFPSPKDSQNAEIIKRRDELRKALEEIEGALQAHTQKASTRSPAVKSCLEDAEKTVSPRELVQALQDDQDTRVQSASSKAGSFMQKLFPISKMALGLTGALVSNAGYPPVQIATNALINVFEVNCLSPKLYSTSLIWIARHEHPETIR